ncbi:alkaline phosphatase family protein [Schaalia vaccimaxillae]|uniref:alkaline phosphatase family protein n=1 Tax=Schaalia vaccimaxillae TaxID=183916 RepID=UPI0003B6A4FF|nr:alkaline phosphatase family protein [Schaalia vaccimaxillae]
MHERPTGLDLPGADLPTADEPLLTDVLGASLAALDPALPGADDGAREALGIASDAEQLLVILADGLGYYGMADHFGHAPTLRSMRNDIRSIHTVVPSTTAAAITAFGTGAFPGATRMVGYSVLHNYSVMNLLAFEGGPAVEDWQSVKTRFELLAEVGVESAVVSPSSFAGSGLTRAALRGSRHVGAFSWEERCAAALGELRKGTRVVYLYWSDIDHAGHGHGIGSPQWVAALEDFDRGLGSLLRRLPAGVRCVLTADHGMVNVERSDLADLAAQPGLGAGVVAIAGETRAVHVHAELDEEDAVIERWRNELGDRAWILVGDEIAAVIGTGPGVEVVGTALVLMRERFGVVDSRTQSFQSIAMPGVHGSLTPEEMRIPVLQLA